VPSSTAWRPDEISSAARPHCHPPDCGRGEDEGGIIIPDTAKEKPQEGEVIAVGPGARDESGELVPLDLKAGDRVLFGKWSSTEVKIEGEDLLIMKESDIMGIIEQPMAKKKKRPDHLLARTSNSSKQEASSWLPKM
jgi:chaperonin GroES